eukprot:4290532-Prymnesium_polylepis.1
MHAAHRRRPPRPHPQQAKGGRRQNKSGRGERCAQPGWPPLSRCASPAASPRPPLSRYATPAAT